MKKSILIALLSLFSMSNVANAQTNVRIIEDINPGPMHGSFIDPLILSNNTMLFFADNGNSGIELWKCGQNFVVEAVKDINPGQAGSYQTSYGIKGVVINSVMYFMADDGSHGRELWRSDGTTIGTGLVKDINIGLLDGMNPSSNLNNTPTLQSINGILFFEGDDGTNNGLWKSDGTFSGTEMVKDSIVLIKYATVAGNILYFSAYHTGTTRTELWRSDGTYLGTYPVVPSSNANVCCGLQPQNIVFKNGTVFFSGIGENLSGRELWKSDGTPSGTSMVLDINGGTASSNPERLTIVPGIGSLGYSLFFTAYNSTNGRELWKSDGSGANTVMVKDIYIGPESSSIDSLVFNDEFTHHNGFLYFSANDGIYGNELWISNGYPNGTMMKEDIRQGSASSMPKSFYNQAGTIYFSADDGIWGREIYETSQTSLGALILEDIRSNNNGSFPDGFIDFDGVLFFGAESTYNGFEIHALLPNYNDYWRTLTSGTIQQLQSIYFGSQANPGYTVGGSGTILKSIDNGVTWVAQNSGVTSNLFDVQFVSATTGYVVGAGGVILKTINGGLGWVQQTSGITTSLFSVYFTDEQTGWIVGSGGIILKTTNGGGTWNLQSSGISTTLLSVQFVNPSTGYAVGLSGVILKTTNGGSVWSLQSSGTTNHLRAISFANEFSGLAAGEGGTILKTINGGTNWTISNTQSSSPFFCIVSVDSDTSYVAGGSGLIMKTTNGGNTWQAEENLTCQTIYSLHLFNNDIYGSGSGGKLIQSYQGSLSSIHDEEINSSKDNILIYPNPTTEEFNISNLGAGEISVEIYTVSGEKIYSAQIVNSKSHIVHQNLSSGIYFVKVNSPKGMIVKKLIKN